MIRYSPFRVSPGGRASRPASEQTAPDAPLITTEWPGRTARDLVDVLQAPADTAEGVRHGERGHAARGEAVITVR